MRLDRTRGEPASDLIARFDEGALADLLERNADEPHAAIVARLLERERPSTSHAVARAVRSGLAVARPDLPKQAIKDSVRRTFQALRMAVNAERPALEALLAALPARLASDGRVVVITFHVGEERLVREAFRTGRRSGVFSEVSEGILRPSRTEILANRRSSSARMHWAVKALGAAASRSH
jgi:16S rRNA (cytosine1402-N4)-methyltransferase